MCGHLRVPSSSKLIYKFQNMLSSNRVPRKISYSAFLSALERSIEPGAYDRHGLPGIDGKRHYYPKEGLYSAMSSLSDDEAKILRALIKKNADLPKLDPAPKIETAKKFLEVYRKIKSRPAWEPVIRSPEDSALLRSRRSSVRDSQQKLIEKAIREGRLHLFDSDQVPQDRYVFSMKCFIPVADAIEYVKSLYMNPEEVFKGVISFAAPEQLRARGVKQRYPQYIKKMAVELLEIGDHAAGARLLPCTIQAFQENARRWKREFEAAQPS